MAAFCFVKKNVVTDPDPVSKTVFPDSENRKMHFAMVVRLYFGRHVIVLSQRQGGILAFIDWAVYLNLLAGARACVRRSGFT